MHLNHLKMTFEMCVMVCHLHVNHSQVVCFIFYGEVSIVRELL